MIRNLGYLGKLYKLPYTEGKSLKHYCVWGMSRARTTLLISQLRFISIRKSPQWLKPSAGIEKSGVAALNAGQISPKRRSKNG